MKITIICEGKTEVAFKECLHDFLKTKLAGKMPALKFDVHDGSIPAGNELGKIVDRHLTSGPKPSNAVIGLTDVYPNFADAKAAKSKMRTWVGPNTSFHPHVALHDFEAWLLPYWDRIQKLAGRQSAPLGVNPEAVNHDKPPAHRLSQLFEIGKCRDSYKKPRDAARILRGADLMVSIKACPELKAFVNTIIGLCDPAKVIP